MDAETDPAAGTALYESAASRPIVLIHGAMQTGWLRKVAQACGEIGPRFTFLEVTDRVDLRAALARLDEAERARIICVWAQIGAPADPLDVGDLLPAEAEIVTFPLLSLECLWPLRGPDPRMVPEPPLYPHGRYRFADRVAAGLAGFQGSDEDLLQAYRLRCRAELADMRAIYETDIGRIRKIDAKCAIKVGDFIEMNMRRRRLFWAPFEPTGIMLIYLVRHLLGWLPLTVEARRRTERTLELLEGSFLGPMVGQHPVSEQVAQRLGLAWVDPAYRYRCFQTRWTFDEYIINYVRWSHWCT